MTESTVFTDDWTGYNGLASIGNYTHKRMNHAEKIYVVTDGLHSIHTNTIEGFWSLVKRGIGRRLSRRFQEIFAELSG